MVDEFIDVYNEIFDFWVVVVFDFGIIYSGYVYFFY